MPTSWIDTGPKTYLPICSCGWRGLTASTKTAADGQRAAHEARCHPDTTQARRAAAAQIRRTR